MPDLPDAVFIVDPNKEETVREANRLNICHCYC